MVHNRHAESTAISRVGFAITSVATVGSTSSIAQIAKETSSSVSILRFVCLKRGRIGFFVYGATV